MYYKKDGKTYKEYPWADYEEAGLLTCNDCPSAFRELDGKTIIREHLHPVYIVEGKIEIAWSTERPYRYELDLIGLYLKTGENIADDREKFAERYEEYKRNYKPKHIEVKEAGRLYVTECEYGLKEGHWHSVYLVGEKSYVYWLMGYREEPDGSRPRKYECINEPPILIKDNDGKEVSCGFSGKTAYPVTLEDLSKVLKTHGLESDGI